MSVQHFKAELLLDQLWDLWSATDLSFFFQALAKNFLDAIRKMTRLKSSGHNGLSIEHLQYVGPHLLRLLNMFFSQCMCHSYLPGNLMRTIVVPIIKNKTGDLTDRGIEPSH